MLTSYHLQSHIPGPHILFTGCIHGNEPAGKIAIETWLAENHELISGEVTCIPVCNPEAYKQGVRYMHKNLNRIINKYVNPVDAEEVYAHEIATYIQQADLLVDLHTTHGTSSPYLFLDFQTPTHRELAVATTIGTYITNRPKLFVDNHSGYDTCSYANTVQTVCVTIECGGHTDKKSIETAYQVICSVLDHYGITKKTSHKGKNNKKKVITMQNKYIKLKAGTLHVTNKDIQRYKKGTLLASYKDGENIYMPYNGYIILPHQEARVGDERFFVGL